MCGATALSGVGSSSVLLSSHSKPSATKIVAQTYDLVSATGRVYHYGGAGWYGDARHIHLNGTIIAMSVAPHGTGYWLAGARGSVYNFGSAKWYHSLANQRLAWSQYIVSIHSTADGKGYWLINRSGVIHSFGDAPPITYKPGQTSHLSRLVGGAVTPSGHGAWLTNAAGDIYTVGAATNYGSLSGQTLSSPITAIASTPDGRGYWLTDQKGDVFGFGDAAMPNATGSAPSRVVGITASNTQGYWATTVTGVVISGGGSQPPGTTQASDNQQAPKSQATSSNAPLPSNIRAIAATVQPPPKYPPAPAGSIGYDVNWPQCGSNGSSQAGPLPTLSSKSVAVVGVDGWATGPYNPCLASEAAWAQHASWPFQLYMFLNSPGSPTDGGQTGPAGNCSTLTNAPRQRCIAYNYGYNAAVQAVAYATSADVHSNMWWIDVENGSCAPGEWSNPSNAQWWSCDLWLNAATIQGAINGLRSQHVVAGIYGTSLQWGQITNNYVVPGPSIPLWVAGAYWTSPPYPTSYHYPPPSQNAGFCAGNYDFAGGTAQLLQETPGNNGYPYDPDLAC
ncbi:MAG: glycoside hydrolase family 25 domain-containing protein [Acidimicrobiales bacterium]